MNPKNRIRVAVLFGGKSLEHEISVISAYQIMEAFDASRYELIPVYIDAQGLWYTGPELQQRRSYLPGPRSKASLHRVSLITGPRLELQPLASRWSFWRRSESQQIDLVFPALHGGLGEDGCLQGMLEVLGCPYVGAGPLAAAVAMNKRATHAFAASMGIPVLPSLSLLRRDWDPLEGESSVERVLSQLSLPLIVKPCNLGSSIGVSAAHTPQELLCNIAAAFVLDHEILIEPLLESLAEYNVAVMAPRGSQTVPQVSAVERPKRAGSVLTFEQKYMRGGSKKMARTLCGMADLARDLNPVDAPAQVLDNVRHYARQVFQQLGLRGSPRFDFLYDQKEGRLYLNEINPMPGSCAFYLWEAAQPRLGFTELLHDLVQEALADFAERNRSQRVAPSRIFQPEPITR